MIDKNGKILSKISIIDIVIVLAVVLCIAGAFIRFSGLLGDNKTSPVEFEYVIRLQQVREKSAEAVAKKGCVYSNLADNSYMGEITDVQIVPNDDYSVIADGSIVKTSAPDRYDVYATVKVSGKQTGTALYTSSGKLIEVGSLEYIATKWVAAGGEIVSVSFLD